MPAILARDAPPRPGQNWPTPRLSSIVTGLVVVLVLFTCFATPFGSPIGIMLTSAACGAGLVYCSRLLRDAASSSHKQVAIVGITLVSGTAFIPLLDWPYWHPILLIGPLLLSSAYASVRYGETLGARIVLGWTLLMYYPGPLPNFGGLPAKTEADGISVAMTEHDPTVPVLEAGSSFRAFDFTFDVAPAAFARDWDTSSISLDVRASFFIRGSHYTNCHRGNDPSWKLEDKVVTYTGWTTLPSWIGSADFTLLIPKWPSTPDAICDLSLPDTDIPEPTTIFANSITIEAHFEGQSADGSRTFELFVRHGQRLGSYRLTDDHGNPLFIDRARRFRVKDLGVKSIHVEFFKKARMDKMFQRFEFRRVPNPGIDGPPPSPFFACA